MMIEPNYFQFNSDAAIDNAYMNVPDSECQIVEQVMGEFDGLVSSLEKSGITVKRFASQQGCPDAVWPNNWVATLPDDKGIISYSLFPMKTDNRRRERNNSAVLEFLDTRYTKGLEKDWSIGNEEKNRILEGTGSLCLDHKNKIAYASVSERTHTLLVEEWAAYYGYKLVKFAATHVGKTVYHTNVIMAVGISFVVVALETIHEEYHKNLLQHFKDTEKHVIKITGEQVSHFCGNILELEGEDSKRILAMSSQAFNTFTNDQKKQFYDLGIDQIVHSDISTLESIGGGSCRCMLAELF